MLDQITARLQAALPQTVPVLQPGEVLTPAQWQEETPDGEIRQGGERGLHVYLRQKAPQGFVQLQHPAGLNSDGVLDIGTVTVHVYAATLASANALARQVRRAIGSLPTRPSHQQFLTATPLEQADHARIVLLFETRAIGV